MKWIVSRDFNIETEVGFFEGTVDLDISGDHPRVVSIGLDSDKIVIGIIKDFLTDWIEDSEDYRTRDLRAEERDWRQSEEADAWRKERDLEDD